MSNKESWWERLFKYPEEKGTFRLGLWRGAFIAFIFSFLVFGVLWVSPIQTQLQECREEPKTFHTAMLCETNDIGDMNCTEFIKPQPAETEPALGEFVFCCPSYRSNCREDVPPCSEQQHPAPKKCEEIDWENINFGCMDDCRFVSEPWAFEKCLKTCNGCLCWSDQPCAEAIE